MNGSPLPRCNSNTHYSNSSSSRVRCPADKIVNPYNSLKYEENYEISETVQIKPQHVSLQLRVNVTLELDFYYEQAQDYPVDLYYLADLSKSMEDDKERLSTLGGLLCSTMHNFTSNFRLGFGSFVDKVEMPYVSTVPRK